MQVLSNREGWKQLVVDQQDFDKQKNHHSEMTANEPTEHVWIDYDSETPNKKAPAVTTPEGSTHAASTFETPTVAFPEASTFAFTVSTSDAPPVAIPEVPIVTTPEAPTVDLSMAPQQSNIKV